MSTLLIMFLLTLAALLVAALKSQADFAEQIRTRSDEDAD